jgi:glycosyltransferase involved in cell wall biosynthesis
VRGANELQASERLEAAAPVRRRPLLSVVVPVYNGGAEIVENVAVIRAAVTERVEEGDFEVLVVSDGSIDGTDEMLLAARSEVGIRVVHYDRNLGKGYAVKLGTLASTGRWVAIVDADLDLHPAGIPVYLETAIQDDLDFAIGSKRHPDSVVHYPRSRRVASWCYQQLNRALFQLDVRDTQVGLKVFRAEIADEVVPLLLVKQFAFDLELLAVARALGYDRVREMPVRLDYRFTGSAVRSSAVVRALVDTVAIFYRLRVLRTYQRKHAFLRSYERLPESLPLVTTVAEGAVAASLDYPALEAAATMDRATAARGAHGELLAIVSPGARPAGNWVAAAVPYFAEPDIAAVVAPTIAPPSIPFRERVAAAVLESRLGGGSRRAGSFPGNVRTVTDHSAEGVVVRRQDYLESLAEGVGDDRLVAWLAGRGRKTVYTPDTSISASPPPILGEHLRSTLRQARSRGGVARATRGSSMSAATAMSVAPFGLALVALGLIVVGSTWTTVAIAMLAGYGALLVFSAALAAVRFRSPGLGALMPFVLVATQAAYVGGFVSGLVSGTSRQVSSTRPTNDLDV